MKKLTSFLLTFILPISLYSQCFIKVCKTIRPRRFTRIERRIRTNIPKSFNAIEVAKRQSLNRHTNWSFTNTSSRVEVTINRKLAEHSLKSPKQIYGPYNYVRTFSRVSKQESLIEPSYLLEWRGIQESQGYNGAHHLVNKYTIKLIHDQMKAQGIKFNLSECQNNAPAIFHPLHGDPKYQYIFHNPLEQYELYFQYGMKSIIIRKLYEINQLNIERGLPELPQEYIDGLLKETELWTRYHGLMWERF